MEAGNRHPYGLRKRSRAISQNMEDELPEVEPARSDDTNPPARLEQRSDIPPIGALGSDLRHAVLRKERSNTVEVRFRRVNRVYDPPVPFQKRAGVQDGE